MNYNEYEANLIQKSKTSLSNKVLFSANVSIKTKTNPKMKNFNYKDNKIIL